MSAKMGRREFIGTAAVTGLALPAMLKGMETSSEAADAKKSGMRVIAVEEHVGTPQITAAFCIEATIFQSVSIGKPSSMIKPALR